MHGKRLVKWTSFVILDLAVAGLAFGGVDQGNPHFSFRSVYNLIHDYRLQVVGEWDVDFATNPDVARIDVVSTYRAFGHFEIASADGGRPASCANRKIVDTTLALFWIGTDCSHPFFVREFETVFSAIQPVAFNKGR